MTDKKWPYGELVGFRTFPRWEGYAPEIPNVLPAPRGKAKWIVTPRGGTDEVDNLLPVFKAGALDLFWRYGVFRPARSK